ncbi:MAG: GGDEF domain-containing protein [Treponema sp.]|jgi:diguanylate cyclase (GGDEF)-like protein|nr:GGDEF domain-containing protein [Treponema sp.]
MPDGKMPLSPVADPVLIKSPLFAAMSELEFNAITAFLERRKVKKGAHVFREGDVGEEMFILLSGLLSAFVSQSDGTGRWMFDISPGDFFGEMSIIANEPRSATISAKIDTEIMVLQGIDFYRIVFEHPMIGLKLLQAIGTVQNQWLDQTSKHLEDLMRWGETARRRAITDELTGLYNRRFLEESIKNRFEHSSVNLRKMSLIMMDLDKVHEINDKHGSQAGDQAIVAVADILRSIMRSEDIASRLSGDEYAVLLPDTDAAEAALVAERIRKAVETKEVIVPKSPGAAERMPINIRTSIGIAVAPTHAKNVESLIFAADSALRDAKDLGRNRVVICKQAG